MVGLSNTVLLAGSWSASGSASFFFSPGLCSIYQAEWLSQAAFIVCIDKSHLSFLSLTLEKMDVTQPILGLKIAGEKTAFDNFILQLLMF